MNTSNLKIFGILLLTIFSQISHSMEDPRTENETKSDTLSHLTILPAELKESVVEPLLSDIYNHILNAKLNDNENLETDLCNLVNEVSNLIRGLPIRKVDTTFNSITSSHASFRCKYFLTLKLSQINISIRIKLLQQLKMDKRCSELIIVLLTLSTLNQATESFGGFKKAYNRIKQAIDSKSLGIFRNYGRRFSCFGVLQFDPAKFEDTKLLKMFINHQNIFNIYEIIFCLKSDLKKELLKVIANQDSFIQQYLNTDLAQAIYSKDLDKVKEILSSDIDINVKCNEIGFTPLILATIFEAEEIIEYLLDNEAEPIIRNRYAYLQVSKPSKQNALYYAAASKNARILKLFLIRSWHFNLKKLFKIAISTNNLKLIYWILAQDAFINQSLSKKQTLLSRMLILSTKKNRKEIFEILMKFIDADEFFCSVNPCLSAALENNSFEMAIFLANISKKLRTYFFGYDVLRKLVIRGNLTSIKFLLSLSINITACSNDKSHYAIAIEHGHKEIAELLKQWMLDNNIEFEHQKIEESATTDLNSVNESNNQTESDCIIG